jgi:hypothetical protein
MILHDRWLRTQTQRIEAFALGPRVSDEDRTFIERLAAEWEVPMIAVTELGEFGQALGREVPLRLRPKTSE